MREAGGCRCPAERARERILLIRAARGFGTLALAVRLQASNALTPLSIESLLALVMAFIGMAMGAKLRARLSGAGFQKALFITFIGLGLANSLRGH